MVNKDIMTVIVHTLLGAAIFYFFVHPITMTIYISSSIDSKITSLDITTTFIDQLGHSFSPKMLGMAVAYIIIGSVVGLISGIYTMNILKKNKIIRIQEDHLHQQIVSILRMGESEYVEFKSSLRYDLNKKTSNVELENAVIKNIAGLMNSLGGRLILGVSDESEILGIENDYLTLKKKDRDGFELKIFELVSHKIGVEFCSLLTVRFYKIDGKDICEIEIKPSSSPCYVHSKNDTLFYVRTGNSTKPLSVKQAVDYIKLSKNLK